ncbi:hypothetical protein [Sphingomonas colocasiae]|uniref:Uncharacterized protein n=1 Tax=Sphingomonas colocasiae TaxID=1848973 RepID=A0ABS7PVZ7_9SPHN|nr:hypothetical protein [Sphingomonas colocasiae]MBY8825537.1 hypothetical protein [Sphingomonas colocasiae]
MLRAGWHRTVAGALGVVAICATTYAHAGPAELADAYADVVTFGAWGRSRDLNEARLERLKAQYELQLQRERNLASAQIYSTRIVATAEDVANSQDVGQQMLQGLATIKILEAQLKQIVVERYQSRSNISRFSTWFDGFVTGNDKKLVAILELLRELDPDDDKTVKALLVAAKLDAAQTREDAAIASEYLKSALQAASSGRARETLATVAMLRTRLTGVLERQRERIRRLVNRMAADDAARRTLCDPPYVLSVNCDDKGACSYYSADPSMPLPCQGLTYFDVFPVSAVQSIVAHPENYAVNAEFFVDLGKLATPGKITKERFRSTTEIFGDELKPEALLPAAFIFPDRCSNAERYAQRLREAFDYVNIFAASDETTPATRANINRLKAQRPIIDFWLESLHDIIPDAQDCASMTAIARRRSTMLVLAVAAAEAFNTALTAGDRSSEDPAKLAPIDILTQDF